MRDRFLQAFRTGFLHALGRVLGAPAMARYHARADGAADSVSADDLGGADPLEWALRPYHLRWRRLPNHVRARLTENETSLALRGLLEHLEGARTDALLIRRFDGAVRHLQPRVAGDRDLSRSSDPVVALLGLLALEVRGVGSDSGPAPDTGAGPEGAAAADQGSGVRKAFERLAPAARLIGADDDPEAAYRLAEFVVYDLLPVLLALGRGARFARFDPRGGREGGREARRGETRYRPILRLHTRGGPRGGSGSGRHGPGRRCPTWLPVTPCSVSTTPSPRISCRMRSSLGSCTAWPSTTVLGLSKPSPIRPARCDGLCA